MLPAAKVEQEDLSDVLDNPLSAMYAAKHPEIVEKAQNDSAINESLEMMKQNIQLEEK